MIGLIELCEELKNTKTEDGLIKLVSIDDVFGTSILQEPNWSVLFASFF